jgi:hypothetical protein
LVLHDDAEEYVEDDDEDYDDVSSYSSDDEQLSDDYSSIDPGCESYNDVLDQDKAVQHHRAAFYRMYHARSVATNKKCINEQLGYYGVPKDAVECFIKTCPKVILVFNFFCQLSIKFTILPC